MMKLLVHLRKLTFLKWRNDRRRREIAATDIVVPGSVILDMLERARKSRDEAQKYERKPDAERLDGEVKILSWLLKYDSEQKTGE